MKDKTPYNTGELRVAGGNKVMIVGHIWWPVEKRNAYHCLPINNDGSLRENGKPQYIWDYTDGNWPEFHPVT